jgi:hypothetical protein
MASAHVRAVFSCFMLTFLEEQESKAWKQESTEMLNLYFCFSPISFQIFVWDKKELTPKKQDAIRVAF